MHEGTQLDWISTFIAPQTDFLHLTLMHLSVIVLCLLVVFRTRGQTGGTFIMAGVGVLLLRELVLLFSHYEPVYTIITTGLSARVGIAVFFGTLLVAFGLIGLGVMRPHQKLQIAGTRVNQWLNIALFAVIILELMLLIDRLIKPMTVDMPFVLQGYTHFASLFLLLLVVSFRRLHHSSLSRQAAASERQLEAMLSMFSVVKHDLNNDMQVVVGNAELAEILIESGGDVCKPVKNITQAASIAVERIEQLSVFSAAGEVSPFAIDLNAVLRETTNKLADELPAIVTLRLDLEHLPIRVMADRNLLSLSLTHLIRQSVKTMEHGGEIVINTCDKSRESTKPGIAVVNAEVFIVRALSGNYDSEARIREKSETLHLRVLSQGIATTKALVERSGAISVRYSLAPEKSLINMGFVTESVAPAREGVKEVSVSCT